jgi:nitroreductase
MNRTLQIMNSRKSVRAYRDTAIPEELKVSIIQAAMRAPTAGNLMLYSILDITDPAIKERLAVTCDHQPFIAKAPLLLLFLADYQRWYDYFQISGVPEMCRNSGHSMRVPQEGDLFLACCDALIAAQNAVIAAESLGIGSCYIGDIMENYEIHKQLLNLPAYVFPIALICFGYPTVQQKHRKKTARFEREYIVFENRYRRLSEAEFKQMYKGTARDDSTGGGNIGQQVYIKKFTSAFSLEMNRSVRKILENWTAKDE